MLGDPIPAHRGMWVTYGLVDEWTAVEEPPPESRYSRVTFFKAVAGAVAPSPEVKRGDFHYFELPIQPGPDRPENFAGMSGGGLWRVLIRDDGGSLSIAESLLTGVLFWQTERTADGRKLICHGRRSIYQAAVARLRTS